MSYILCFKAAILKSASGWHSGGIFWVGSSIITLSTGPISHYCILQGTTGLDHSPLGVTEMQFVSSQKRGGGGGAQM
jgi:hypothetical protein